MREARDISMGLKQTQIWTCQLLLRKKAPVGNSPFLKLRTCLANGSCAYHLWDSLTLLDGWRHAVGPLDWGGPGGQQRAICTRPTRLVLHRGLAELQELVAAQFPPWDGLRDDSEMAARWQLISQFRRNSKKSSQISWTSDLGAWQRCCCGIGGGICACDQWIARGRVFDQFGD